MMNPEVTRAHMRLSALLALRAQPAHEANFSLIRDCMAEYHFSLSDNQVKSLVRWLAENDLVVEDARGATLTDYGVMVTSGKSLHDGVRKPSHDTVQRMALAEAGAIASNILRG